MYNAYKYILPVNFKLLYPPPPPPTHTKIFSVRKEEVDDAARPAKKIEVKKMNLGPPKRVQCGGRSLLQFRFPWYNAFVYS